MALDDMETRQVNKWQNEMLPSQKVWIELALKGVPANQLVENSAYKLYLRYAIEYDDLLFQRIKESDKIKIMVSPSPAEMDARIHIWVKAKRPNWYVEKMLGLENNAQFKGASKEYQLFLKLQKEQK
ncbi:hypothetical protein JG688_00007090 [Phytophthora aleatoria]|uniref:RxLR effector protein n=1 Tax=Phytophthora aleatoria TaxID=2496075 RepID=A0A8J5IYV1_9STRA|nr:hypothetical protein JG688_00007090 [Phytophthora aleatoria]